MEIQERFARRMREVFPEKGQAWLDALPAAIAELEERWQIRVEDAFPDLSYNYVAPATTAEGRQAVLACLTPRSARPTP
jgi:streptomycin 6-kinase